MTCVANAILSFELKARFEAALALCGWVFDLLVAVRDGVGVVVGWGFVFVNDVSSASRSSLRATMVAGVQVDVDDTAALIASRSSIAVVMIVVK
jgi:hypothetical protein